jgi:hypothetical protein
VDAEPGARKSWRGRLPPLRVFRRFVAAAVALVRTVVSLPLRAVDLRPQPTKERPRRQATPPARRLGLPKVRRPAALRRRRAKDPVDSSHWRFAGAVVFSCLGLLGATFALNVIVDPFALAGTDVVPSAVETDRAIKLTLIERLERSPGILIHGSSRARQAEPAYLQQLTGHTGFNAGVTGGTAADAWVFTRYAADRFPGTKRRYVWFVDSGVATNGVNPQLEEDPRAKKYLRERKRFGLKDVATYIGTQASRASIRVIRKCVIHTCQARIHYNPDGSIPHSQLRYLPEQGKNLKAAAAKLVASIRANPPGPAGPVNPKRYEFFERTLAYMNARGERPVIVLNPVYPTVLAELEKHGYPARKASLDYLRKLHSRFDFVVVNCQDIRVWGGSARDFTNPTHVNWRNMRRMLKYVVGHSDGALS